MQFFLPRPLLRALNGLTQEPEGYGEACRLASERKKKKRLKYVRASRMKEYVEAAKGGAPFDEAAEFGAASLRQRVNCRGAEPLPYYVGQFDFYADAGLYLLVYAEDEADADWMQELLLWLGCAGIGGKRSSGYGKFHLAEDAIFLDEAGVYADDAALFAMLEAKGAPWQMTLSSVLPDDASLAVVRTGQYRLRRSGGFITAPRGEAKSDLEIARLLTRRLNELAPHTSTFPHQKEAADFLDETFTPIVYERLSIQHWRELEKGTRSYDVGIPWADHQFATDDGKFHCCSLTDMGSILFPTQEYPFYFLTPHAQQNINSQHQMPETQLPEHPIVFLHPKAAAAKGLSENSAAILWNEMGELHVTVCLTETVPQDTILCPQGESRVFTLNWLNAGQSADMGEVRTGTPGVALHDVLVNIRAK